MTDLVPVTRALISLSDKDGLDALADGLKRHKVEIVSTGGTAARLREFGAEVRDISDLTGFSEMMDGRVKTLHPKVHGGLLAVRDNPEHAAAMVEHDIAPIDLVVVNLYPFLKTLMSGADRDTIIENIDIGGPSMVRSSAKNHAHVACLTDPADYAELLGELDANGGQTSLAFRRRLAAKAFALTAEYDSTISQWFAFGDQGERFPKSWSQSNKLKMPLRYGENPHQKAALYLPVGPNARGIAQAEQVQGKELSYNNLNDASAALDLVSEFRDGDPAVVIIKHANPCGVAQRPTMIEAWSEALACDSVSAFGGIVATNRPLDAATAEAITQIFTEVVVAPDADEDAKAIFARKKNLAPVADRRIARSDPRRANAGGDRRGPAGPGPRQCPGHARHAELRDQAPTDRAGIKRLPVRLDRRQARQVECHRLCQGRGHRRGRRGPDEPPRQRAHRRASRQGGRRGQWLARGPHDRLGGRL